MGIQIRNSENKTKQTKRGFLLNKTIEVTISGSDELSKNTKMGLHAEKRLATNLGSNSHIKIVPMRDGGRGSCVGTNALVLRTDSLVQCVLNLSELAIKKLKHEADGSYTSYEIICAHFWQHLTMARGGLQNESAFFCVFANARSRLSAPLPSAYFGNVIMFAAAGSTVGKVSSESLSKAADRIHDAIGTCQESSLLAFMHWLHLNDNHATHAFNPVGQMVFMASSPRFPAYQVDFGWGRPAAVRSVKVHTDGELVIFGGNPRLGGGDVEICVALPADVLKRLLEDPQFLVLSEDMVSDGYQEIMNIDISSVIIEAMQLKYKDYQQLKYMTMDVRDMSSFADQEFDFVIDKGMLDSLMCGSSAHLSAAKMLEEVRRVLKPGGGYMLITYGDPRTRMQHLKTPDQSNCWSVLLHVLPKPGSRRASEKCNWEVTNPVPLKDDESVNTALVVDDPELHYVYICIKAQDLMKAGAKGSKHGKGK